MFSRMKKLRESLSETRDSVFGNIVRVLTGRKIDNDLIDELEEVLLKSDIGVAATDRIIDNLRERSAKEKVSKSDEVIELLKDDISEILGKNRRISSFDGSARPMVWMITGVNGSGKTTTVGKLAHHFRNEGRKVMIAACDTFRAAAVEQLAIWSERSGVDIIRAQSGADPAAVAFDAATAAKSRGLDLLLVDTAGRLHTKTNLMAELEKMRRVTEKVVPSSQILAKLVIDGTTGQNAVSQVKVFMDAVGCDGLIITKLDGTAKGGVIVAIAEEFSVPVEFIGIGERIEDLQAFDAESYAEALFYA
ncbi:MAG: signal recognition particle-docking protein FtsY [Candidatus Zixiibacteriota bacterium]|nr:MAG: signal recognition particle-docking protein FtsY [candidate division Zixibacteria bacterium]